MVPRKDLVVDKDDPGFKRSERILSIGSPKQDTPDVSPESAESGEHLNWKPITDTQDVPPIQDSEVFASQQTTQQNLRESEDEHVTEISPDPQQPVVKQTMPEPPASEESFKLSESPKQETTAVVPEASPIEEPSSMLLEPQKENTPQLTASPENPEKESDQLSDDDMQADQIVILKPLPQKKGIADLNNLNSSFEIAVLLDPPESDDLFPENDPADSIEMEFTSPLETSLETPLESSFESPLGSSFETPLERSLETSIEIDRGLETILETSRENETGDTSTDLDLEPQKEVMPSSESDEIAEKARQDQMKRLLDDPEIKPVSIK